MAIKIQKGREIYQNVPFQGEPKCTKIFSFGIYIYYVSGNPGRVEKLYSKLFRFNKKLSTSLNFD
jgi:hypothetical protein